MPEFSNKKNFLKNGTISINESSYLFLKKDSMKYKKNNLLFFTKNDTIFIVVTKKENYKNCELLAKNKSYSLKLISTRPKEIINYLDFNSYPMYEDEVVSLIKGNNIVWDLFLSPDLKNDCYKR